MKTQGGAEVQLYVLLTTVLGYKLPVSSLGRSSHKGALSVPILQEDGKVTQTLPCYDGDKTSHSHNGGRDC
jgi:hypothetical protein